MSVTLYSTPSLFVLLLGQRVLQVQGCSLYQSTMSPRISAKPRKQVQNPCRWVSLSSTSTAK